MMSDVVEIEINMMSSKRERYKVDTSEQRKPKEDLAKERNELINQRTVEEPLIISQPIDTIELVESMAQESLKEKDISQFLQEKNQLEKSNKEKQEKINRLKDRLLGKEVLKSA